MRMMVDLGNTRGPLHIIDTSTEVDCAKELKFRRTFRSLVECMVPCCCAFQTHLDSCGDPANSTVTGTFFGYRKGRVSFCLQDDPRGQPLLLLEFAVPTSYLAREMQHGLLRIALESARTGRTTSTTSTPLFSVPSWAMYCNGRRVGFAARRQAGEADAAVLKLMRSVSVGAGILPGDESKSGEGDLMYLRASFKRVVGSADSESFHMLSPDGSGGQELSIFLLRS